MFSNMEFMWLQRKGRGGGSRSRERMLKLQQSWAWHGMWPQNGRENALEKLIFIMLKASRIAAKCSCSCLFPFHLPLPPVTLFASAFFSTGTWKIVLVAYGTWYGQGGNGKKGRREDCCTAAGAAKLAAQFEILKWFFVGKWAGGQGAPQKCLLRVDLWSCEAFYLPKNHVRQVWHLNAYFSVSWAMYYVCSQSLS